MHSSATGAGSQLATGPWHVMRNGTNAVFSEGEADEVALYTRALSAAEVQEPLRSRERPRRRPAAGEPARTREPSPRWPAPARRGGVLGPGNPLPDPAKPTGRVTVRRGTLTARGAPGVHNITARRSGRNWRVSDKLAGLQLAGRGCRAGWPES